MAQQVIGSSNPNSFAEYPVFGPRVFAANDQTRGMELWTIDISGVVTPLADIAPLDVGSEPTSITPTGIGVFAAANDGLTGVELWEIDLNGGPHSLVADLSSGSSNPELLTESGGSLFFVADAGNGRELHVYDGGSVTMVGGLGADPRELMKFQGGVVFSADDGTNGREMWFSDGVTSWMVANLDGVGSGNPHGFTEFQGKVYFAGRTSTEGMELRSTDVTSQTIQLAWDVNQGAGGSGVSRLHASAELLFVADDGTGTEGAELWTFDGTTASMIDVRNGPAGAGIAEFTQTSLFDTVFVASNGSGGRELLSYSTSGGLVPFSDAGAGALDPRSLTVVPGGNALIFTGDTPATGRELWRVDLSGGTAMLLKDIWPGIQSSSANEVESRFFNFDLRVYFAANNGVNGAELWATNGSSGGTVMVADIAPDSPMGKQPRLRGHSDSAGSVELCLEGQPGDLGVILVGIPGPPLMLPIQSVGEFRLNLTPPPASVFVILDANGEACISIAVPPGLSSSIQFVAQGAVFDNPVTTTWISDLVAITVWRVFGGFGDTWTTGVLGDEDHAYEINPDLPVGIPDSGEFVFKIVDEAGKETEMPNHTVPYNRSSDGLNPTIQGIMPLLNKLSQLRMFFRDNAGNDTLLWQSYC